MCVLFCYLLSQIKKKIRVEVMPYATLPPYFSSSMVFPCLGVP